MKLLITGGYGQLGSEFARLESDTVDCIRLGSSELDITDSQQVEAQLAAHQPCAVVNAAAYTAVDKAEEESELAYAINRDGVENLARSCAKADIPLLHVSTDYVFSGKKSTPYFETDETGPQGVYGASKLAGENVLRSTWAKHVILRVSWVFGEFGNNFVKTMLRVGAQRDELNVVCDQLGAPTAARSIAENLVAIAALATDTANAENRKLWGTHHFASGPFTSWHGFAEQIFASAVDKKMLSKAPSLKAISSSEYPTPAARPANSQMISERQLDCLTPCHWPSELEQVLKTIRPV